MSVLSPNAVYIVGKNCIDNYEIWPGDPPNLLFRLGM